VVLYRHDDVLEEGSCACGHARKAIAAIEGRRDGLVVVVSTATSLGRWT
jgi:phenylacetate-coenzyme A ligase PaaK-like adenylate-forming protein